MARSQTTNKKILKLKRTHKQSIKPAADFDVDSASRCRFKPALHDADTDTDILAEILTRIVARMSVSVSASWNAGFRAPTACAINIKVGGRLYALLVCFLTLIFNIFFLLWSDF